MSTPEYTFLPWVRYGLGNYINRTDNPADTDTNRAKLNVHLDVSGTPQQTVQEVYLAGPGDVTGIHPQAIIRAEPVAGTFEFDPNALPFVEFYDEDFPWRFSPANPDASQPDRLRPWLMLLVLTENEFSWLGSTEPLPGIKVTEPVLDMHPHESWAWAHVQVNESLPELDENGKPIPAEAALKQVLEKDPDLALSRVVCSRKLKKETHYFAFLVPAFETGRLVGLGMDTSGVPLQQAAWTQGQTDIDFPIYHTWEFSTADDTDFETLARKLRPVPISTFDPPKIDIQDMFEELGVAKGISLAPELTQNTLASSPTALDPVFDSKKGPLKGSTIYGSLALGIESALVPPDHETVWLGDDQNALDKQLRSKLAEQINSGPDLTSQPPVDPATISTDPLVNVPPLYGRWLAARSGVTDPTGNLGDADWLEQMNLNPVFRAAAGLGVEAVNEKQDEFMQQAWEQIGEVREANQRLRQAALGKEVSDRVFKKHLASRDEEESLRMTQRLHKKVHFATNPQSGDSSISKKILETTLPKASLDPAFTKLTRKQGPFTKKLNRKISEAVGSPSEIKKDFVTGIADNTAGSAKEDLVAAAKKEGNRSIMLESALVSQLHANSPVEISATTQQFDTLVADTKAQNDGLIAARTDFATTDFSQAKTRIQEDIAPSKTIPEKTLGLLDMQGGLQKIKLPAGQQLDPVMAHPEFSQPVYKYLLEKHPVFVAPAINDMEINSVSLMKVNQRFIEAFMTGMNQAMGRELLWREYPTDQRGTYFKQFWDSSEHLAGGVLPIEPDDIQPISAWPQNSALGSHGTTNISEDGKVVLLMRGELFRQYPNLHLFAQKAEWHQGQHRKMADPSVTGNVAYPLFRVQLSDDLIGIAFQLDVDQVRGDLLSDGSPDPAGDAGWYFLFKERAGELKFGLDADDNSGNPMVTGMMEDDLHWGQVIDASAANPLQHIPVGPALALDQSIWGANAAEMAWILHQRPFLLGFHASALI